MITYININMHVYICGQLKWTEADRAVEGWYEELYVRQRDIEQVPLCDRVSYDASTAATESTTPQSDLGCDNGVWRHAYSRLRLGKT